MIDWNKPLEYEDPNTNEVHPARLLHILEGQAYSQLVLVERNGREYTVQCHPMSPPKPLRNRKEGLRVNTWLTDQDFNAIENRIFRWGGTVKEALEVVLKAKTPC